MTLSLLSHQVTLQVFHQVEDGTPHGFPQGVKSGLETRTRPQVWGSFHGAQKKTSCCLEVTTETHTVSTKEGRIPSSSVCWENPDRPPSCQLPPARLSSFALGFCYRPRQYPCLKPAKTNSMLCEALAQGVPHLKLSVVFQGLQTQVLQTVMEEIKPKNRCLNRKYF